MDKNEALEHMQDRREYEAREVLDASINKDNCEDLTGKEWETSEDKARTDAYIETIDVGDDDHTRIVEVPDCTCDSACGCDDCKDQYLQDTDVEHEEICKEETRESLKNKPLSEMTEKEIEDYNKDLIKWGIDPDSITVLC